jgi:hypothetical protein
MSPGVFFQSKGKDVNVQRWNFFVDLGTFTKIGFTRCSDLSESCGLEICIAFQKEEPVF